MAERRVFGWDIGGAHLKACLLVDGRVRDAALWACPLWQGLERLTDALQEARERWPAAASAEAAHAVTMTGEMVDLFSSREQGVQRIAALLQATLRGPVRFFAGNGGWCTATEAAERWPQIASANWLATAQHAAQSGPAQGAPGLLVDIGSTTTDFIAFGGGRVLTAARSDAQRLASGELVYQGVVRTPLCALAPRIRWRDGECNVMNEFFATTADVYRLTGELDPAHDLHPSADQAPKDAPATRQRLARMVGLDARDGSPADWLAFAHAWRSAQVAELGAQMKRVWQRHGLPADAIVISAGCGDFLLPALLAQAWPGGAASRIHAYGTEVAPPVKVQGSAPADAAAVADMARVCAPSVAVAALFSSRAGAAAVCAAGAGAARGGSRRSTFLGEQR
jgi:(4-(4-[2-(gamma-L-glutamylamino)ethyl]phenoxymethyl)furan-2-yl)methanamine synthase